MIRVEYKGYVGFFRTLAEATAWKKEIDEQD